MTPKQQQIYTRYMANYITDEQLHQYYLLGVITEEQYNAWYAEKHPEEPTEVTE